MNAIGAFSNQHNLLVRNTMNKSIKLMSYILLCGAFLMFSTHAEDKKMGEYFGAKTATHPEWFKESFLDFEEDIEEATENNKRLVLYFWQPGCPYCNQLWEENFSSEDVVKTFRDNFDIIAMNMWGDREVISVAGKNFTEKSFAAALNIKYTPTLLFFNENKKVVHRLNGYIPVEEFQQSMRYVADKMEKSQTFGEYASATKPPKKAASSDDRKALIPEDFFDKTGSDLTQKAKEIDEYLAVYFEKADCPNCELLHNKTLKDEATRELAKKFISIQLDRFSEAPITTPSNVKLSSKDWADQLGISYLPAILFFNHEGKEVMRVDAQLRTFHIQSVFDYVISGAYKTEENFQRYISARAERIREEGKDVDIFAY